MRRWIPILMALTLLLSGGCGAAGKSAGTSAEQKTMTGTLEEVKSFLFIVTDEQGDSYAFTIEGEKPEGLDEQAVGDQVVVTYTGELSVVDAFTGEVLSVKAAE